MQNCVASSFSSACSEFVNLLQIMSRSLSDYPSDIKIKVTSKPPEVVGCIYANEKDKGKLVGKNGRTINSMRTIFHCAAAKYDLKSDLILMK
jgi:predicted RNA-binding protein YlqC (UPF0109 family)